MPDRCRVGRVCRVWPSLGRILVGLALASFLAPAWPSALTIHRCEADGAVSYSDTPCAGGRSLKEAAPPPFAQTEAARRQLAQDRSQLQRLQSERERRQATEESARQRAEVGRQAHLKRCKLLEMKKRWSDEDARQAQIKQQARARRTADRKTEQFELECGTQR